MRIVDEVTRVSGLTEEQFFEEYVVRNQPVIITDLLRDWPALDRWTPQYLASTFGEQKFQFKRSTSDAHPDFRKHELKEMFARQAMTFSEFTQQLTSGPVVERSRLLFSGDEHFLFRVREGVATLNPDLAALWPDVQLPALFPAQQLYSVWAWFSGLGVRTWLHYDNNGCHNLNAQLSGSKTAWLFPPTELPQLALFPLGGSNPATNCSQIDVDRPDLTRFSEFANASVHQAQLEPGDLLFIPANWLHTFVHRGAWNANVNFWWKPETQLVDPVALREQQRAQSSSY